jgi:ADP-ribose pyrophosphatase YjhB (NUDIX family)
MKHCTECSGLLVHKIPEGDNKRRHLCVDCGWISYNNPKVIVACIVYNDDNELLLIKRAIEPQVGCWSLPAGFMEEGESLQEAACRELYEETGLDYNSDELWLYSIGTLSEMDQVHVNFRVPWRDQPIESSTAEASEIGFFSEAALPWDQLAYSVLRYSALGFYQELKNEHFGVYMGGVSTGGEINFEKVAISANQKMKRLVEPGY